MSTTPTPVEDDLDTGRMIASRWRPATLRTTPSKEDRGLFGHPRGLPWMLNVENFQAVADGLKADGVTIVRPAAQVPGKLCMTFADPEGNPFTLCGVSDNGAGPGSQKKSGAAKGTSKKTK